MSYLSYLKAQDMVEEALRTPDALASTIGTSYAMYRKAVRAKLEKRKEACRVINGIVLTPEQMKNILNSPAVLKKFGKEGR